METIKIGFSRPKNMKLKFFAWAIMKAYGTPYSHVYVRIHSGKYERDLIYQASQTMINFMGMEIFNDEALVVEEFEFQMSDESYKSMMQFAIDSAGTPYGVKECFGMAWVKIMEWCGKTVKNPFSDGGSTYVCSELASYVLKNYLGANVKEDLDDMTPLQVYTLVKELKAQ